jgi:hypothetical protein
MVLKMKKLKILGLALSFCFILFLCQTMPGFSKTETLKAKLPVLTTSAGQSPDVTTVNIVLEEAGIKYDYCDVPTVEIVEAGVGLAGKESGPGFHVEVYTDTEKFPEGTPYKTVIIAIGASLKGMGASGLTGQLKRHGCLWSHCRNRSKQVEKDH